MTLDTLFAASVLLTVVWAIAFASFAMLRRVSGRLVLVLAVGQVLLFALLVFVASPDR